MLAAARVPNCPADRRVASVSEPASDRHRFKVAYADLCSLIWGELAALDDAVTNDQPLDCDTVTVRAAILRLELIVLVDSCRSARWRLSLLTADECDRMCSLLTDVLAALYVEPEELIQGLNDAKDRVLEEFLAQVVLPA